MNEPMNMEGMEDAVVPVSPPPGQMEKPDTSAQAWLSVGIFGAGLLVAAIAAIVDNFVGVSPQKIPETVVIPVEESKSQIAEKSSPEPGGSSSEPWWVSILRSPDTESEDTKLEDSQIETRVEVKVLVPGNENQVACTKNKGGKACFEDDYLVCVRFEDNRCVERKSLEMLEEAPKPPVRWNGRVFNGQLGEF